MPRTGLPGKVCLSEAESPTTPGRTQSCQLAILHEAREVGLGIPRVLRRLSEGEDSVILRCADELEVLQQGTTQRATVDVGIEYLELRGLALPLGEELGLPHTGLPAGSMARTGFDCICGIEGTGSRTHGAGRACTPAKPCLRVFGSRHRLNPRLISDCANRRIEPRSSPRSPHHSDQHANRSTVVWDTFGCSSHSSASQRPRASSSLKYSSVAARTTAGGARPSRCQSRQPSIIHARIAAPSSRSFAGSSGSGWGGRMMNGMRCNRRRIASSTFASCGLWFPTRHSLHCGENSKKLPYRKRAVTRSPPDRLFSLASFHRPPSFVSFAVTRRAPWSAASSVGCRSNGPAMKVLIGACAAYEASTKASVSTKPLLPLPPGPWIKPITCSRTDPVRQ